MQFISSTYEVDVIIRATKKREREREGGREEKNSKTHAYFHRPGRAVTSETNAGRYIFISNGNPWSPAAVARTSCLGDAGTTVTTSTRTKRRVFMTPRSVSLAHLAWHDCYHASLMTSDYLIPNGDKTEIHSSEIMLLACHERLVRRAWSYAWSLH